jgi:hypothetical protein
MFAVFLPDTSLRLSLVSDVKEQFGFRSHSSNEHVTFTLINDIHIAMSNKSIVGGIFCDL